VKALLRKGVSLARLAAADLSFDAGQAYVVYDGHELLACRDAAAAIAAVVRASRWCSAVDLSAIRTDRSQPLYKTDQFLRFKDSPAFVLAVSTCVWP
jgi:hypothetical protein